MRTVEGHGWSSSRSSRAIAMRRSTRLCCAAAEGPADVELDVRARGRCAPTGSGRGQAVGVVRAGGLGAVGTPTLRGGLGEPGRGLSRRSTGVRAGHAGSPAGGGGLLGAHGRATAVRPRGPTGRSRAPSRPAVRLDGASTRAATVASSSDARRVRISASGRCSRWSRRIRRRRARWPSV